MNDFEAWTKILWQYQGVQKLVNLNQNLYDQLTGAIFYLKKYADELDLPLKKREELNLMLERSEILMDSFNATIDRLSDETLQGDKKSRTDDKYTEPSTERYIRFRTVVKICLI